jgi:hypothetical protein
MLGVAIVFIPHGLRRRYTGSYEELSFSGNHQFGSRNRASYAIAQ